MNVTPRAKGFFAVTFVALGVFTSAAFITYSSHDWPFDPSSSIRGVRNISGPVGSWLALTFFELFGRVFAWLIPLAMLALGVATPAGRLKVAARWVVKTTAVVLVLNALFALTPFASEVASLRGRVGDGIASALALVFGEIGSMIVLIAALLLTLLGELGRLASATSRVADGLSTAGLFVKRALGATASAVSRLGRATVGWYGHRSKAGEVATGGSAAAVVASVPEVTTRPDEERWQDGDAGETGGETPIEIITSASTRRPTPKKPSRETREQDLADKKPVERASLPPLSILERGEGAEGSYTKETLKNWSAVLEGKLKNYGVVGKVSAVHHGPVVTTFEFEPAPGVRIKDIVSRADDLALAMKARSLRMIAPIPGRAAVGIEIPNPESRIVYLYDVLKEVSEKQRLHGIMMAIGVDVVGEPFLVNLCDAPHLLIAGTTGSGKSVCLNTIISSILFQYRPSDVKIILVDPKMVEMSMYTGIPHLLHPVINEPKEAANVLEYLAAEMTRRNKLFRHHGVKNIESMNSKISLGKWGPDEEPPERLPYIVVVIDELGDLALAKGVDIESLLARLAQTARAAGIHMVLATQRPSVDVIVGKTKANFPTRIAFRVATKVDSRTIIDTIGADKLLGKGDMLYTDAQNPQPLRLHGAWISEPNLESLISHWKAYRFEESRIDLHAARAGSAQLDDDLDPLFGEARGVVIRFRQGSTSLLQRKLHVGYARAARILDQLEQRGVVGPADGSRPREVYDESTGDDLEG
jgi:S-DNA-T family DNA segregation ATPase FtsK/SpoIIIE